MSEGTKCCGACKVELNISEFCRSRRTKDGLNRVCKACDGIYKAAYREKQKQDPIKAAASREYQRIWHRRDRAENGPANGQLALYNIKREDWRRMWGDQDGRCAICGAALRRGTGGAAVDHCHDTGRVRGLLCVRCNTGLGCFEDSPALMQTAISYIQNYGVVNGCGHV